MNYIILFCIGCALSLIAFFFITPEKNSFYMFMGTLGFCIWIIAIVVGLLEGIKSLKEWNYRRKIKYDENGYRALEEPKEEKTYLIVEFIKAKYNQYCPKIDWIDNGK